MWVFLLWVLQQWVALLCFLLSPWWLLRSLRPPPPSAPGGVRSAGARPPLAGSGSVACFSPDAALAGSVAVAMRPPASSSLIDSGQMAGSSSSLDGRVETESPRQGSSASRNTPRIVSAKSNSRRGKRRLALSMSDRPRNAKRVQVNANSAVNRAATTSRVGISVAARTNLASRKRSSHQALITDFTNSKRLRTNQTESSSSPDIETPRGVHCIGANFPT